MERGAHGLFTDECDIQTQVVAAELEHPRRGSNRLTEQRNVAEDYAKIFGEFPDDPRAITISIDSNDTRSMAESFMGPIVFRAR